MDQLLSHLYLFKGLSEQDLAKVSNIAERKLYEPEETIFSYGEPADCMYLIDHGTVVITFDEEDDTRIEISKMGTGSHFGEMSLLDGEPRSANAVSETHCDIIRIKYDSLLELLESEPQMTTHVYRELARFLCSRLRFTTLDLSEARAQNLSLF